MGFQRQNASRLMRICKNESALIALIASAQFLHRRANVSGAALSGRLRGQAITGKLSPLETRHAGKSCHCVETRE